MTQLSTLDVSNAELIAQMLGKISGGRVLDVCTGKGRFISLLMKTLKDYTEFVGVDISIQDLEAAQENLQKQPVQLLKMRAEKLAFEQGEFDTVCIANSLHHLIDVPTVLGEMKRVLRPGGWFIVKEMYQGGNQSEAQLTEILEHHWTAKIDRASGIFHNETLTCQQIQEYLEYLGLWTITIFDTSWSVKCLFCSSKTDCENPKSQKVLEMFFDGIDENLERLKEIEGGKSFWAEGNQLKERAKQVGVSNASSLFIIGRK
ncbi:MAG: class I SAM-dependent methyltransferase [Candidatus Thorarchaeota archaeon]